MADILVTRIVEGEKSTLGYMRAGKYNCCTMELANRHNQVNISSIPTGEYNWTKEQHRSLGFVVRLHGVQGRSGILIHSANYYRQLRGCIAVGETFHDIDKDGYVDVTDSRDTMEALWHSLPEKGTIEIVKKKV